MNMDEAELLKFAIQEGMLDISAVQKKMEMKRKEEVLAKHPYDIYQDNQGRFCTYFPSETSKSGRVRKTRKSREDLLDDVYRFWKEHDIDEPTVEDIYREWSDAKLKRNEITIQTKNRYDRDYDLMMSEFGKRKIKMIEEYDIEEFLIDSIRKYSLTQKGFSNLRTLVYGTFKYAKKKKIVDFSISQIINDMEVSRRLFRKVSKDLDQLVFMPEEKEKLEKALLGDQDNIISVGLLLLFKTGMRPGELAALKWEDIDLENITVHVHRTEIRYQDADRKLHVEVRNSPKTDAGNRIIVVPDKYRFIFEKLKELNPNGEYLFMKDGARICCARFSYRLRKLCEQLHIVNKSQNKIRKTYATELVESDVSDSFITSQLGHTKIDTTLTYYFKDRMDIDTKKRVVNSIDRI